MIVERKDLKSQAIYRIQFEDCCVAGYFVARFDKWIDEYKEALFANGVTICGSEWTAETLE